MKVGLQFQVTHSLLLAEYVDIQNIKKTILSFHFFTSEERFSVLELHSKYTLLKEGKRVSGAILVSFQIINKNFKAFRFFAYLLSSLLMPYVMPLTLPYQNVVLLIRFVLQTAENLTLILQ